MHKAYYSAVILVALFGIGVSFLISPSNKEVALMHMEDKYFENAFEKYKALHAAGDNSVSVIIPLSKLYLQYGDVESALKLMEEYIQLHPNSIEAHKQLGVFYQYAQQPDNYLRNLERIYSLEPSEKTLRELSDVYSFNAQHTKQIKTLEKLLNNPKYMMIEKDYVGLAHLYSSQKHYKKAMQTLQRLLIKEKGATSIKAMELLVSLMIDVGKDKEAFMSAQKYLTEHQDIRDAIGLASRIRSKGRADLAYKLISPYSEKIKKDPELLAEFMAIKLDLGKRKEVYSQLTILFKQNNVPEGVVETLVELALEYKDYTLLQKIIASTKLEVLSEETLLGYAEISLDMNKPELATALEKNLGKEFLHYSPLLASILALAESKGTSIGRLLTQQQKLHLSNTQKFALVRIYNRVNRPKLAFKLLKTLPIGKTLEKINVIDVAELFIKLNKSEEGLRLLKTAQSNERRGNIKINQAWAMLAAGSGRKDLLIPWLKNSAQHSNRVISDVLSMASKYKHAVLALDIAQLLYARQETSEHRRYLAEALISNKRYKEALSHLKALITKDRQAEQLYIEALAGLIKKQEPKNVAQYKKELYAILNKILSRPNLSIFEKRQISYTLIDAGLPQKAERLLFKLAMDAPAASQDVKQLVYLWGKKPGNKNIRWLEQRALSAKGKEKAQWLGYLVETGNTGKAIALIENIKTELTPPLVDMYIEALLSSKQRKKFARFIAQEVKKNPETKRLQKLATLAIQENLPDIAEKAFRQLATALPNDLQIAKQLGTLLFYKSRYSEAEVLLANYLAEHEGDYQTNYYYGEILWRNREYEKAAKHYDQALQQIRALPSRSVTENIAKAHLLLRRNKLEQSINLFRELLATYPRNSGLKADFASVLMEIGKYEEAELILSGS